MYYILVGFGFHYHVVCECEIVCSPPHHACLQPQPLLHGEKRMSFLCGGNTFQGMHINTHISMLGSIVSASALRIHSLSPSFAKGYEKIPEGVARAELILHGGKNVYLHGAMNLSLVNNSLRCPGKADILVVVEALSCKKS